MQHVDVGGLRKAGGSVEVVKGAFDLISAIEEVEHEEVFFALAELGRRAIEAR